MARIKQRENEIIISIFIEVDYWTRDNLCESEIEKFVINLEEDSLSEED